MAYKVKNCICLFFALAFCLLACVGVRAYHTVRLSGLQGERVFYLDSASSQGFRKTELSILDIPRVKGECVKMDLEGKEGGMYALSLISSFDGEVLFIEEACGRTSYYAYAKGLGEGIWLYGKKVNLHVAVGENTCVVGTPIIFDGF
ncbi:MAG: hypothetical protein IKB20_03730 [Clostridia bacterium]|nr:hypothetical protein [Clostridia bacterium]